MDILFKLLPSTFVFADKVSSDLFGTIAAGANTCVSILKWAALLFVLVKIVIIGFKITTTSKTGSDAVKVIKDEGIALAIGLFIVMTAFLIHSTLKDTLNQIGTSGAGSGTSIDINSSDVFS